MLGGEFKDEGAKTSDPQVLFFIRTTTIFIYETTYDSSGIEEKFPLHSTS